MILRKFLDIATICLGAAFALWLVWFKVVDSDFWWHVKAGEFMWQAFRPTQGDILIQIDPFAWTREGMPYVATHEWLSQLLFYGVFQAGGALGIILLRWFCFLAVAASVLLLDRRHLWPNVFLTLGMGIVMRQGLLERPQLFSNVLFTLTIVLMYRWSAADNAGKWRLLFAWTAIQILWVNLHGAASLLMFIPLGALILQEAWDAAVGHGDARGLRLLFLIIPVLLLAMLMSPNGLRNLTYLQLLLTDRTKDFIQEWSPRTWDLYLPQVGPLWVSSVASLIWTRHRMLESGVLLLVVGILSRMGSRHEVLFMIAAAVVTIVQLRENPRWEQWIMEIRRRHVVAWSATVLACGVLIFLNFPYHRFLQWRGLAGIGTEERGKGAYDFLESEDIGKRMFNTYSLGGYLLYRGAPERKVFVDGRNVDYGYEFLQSALSARNDATTWRVLDTRYDFDVAVIEYAPRSSGGTVEFPFLSGEAAWALVYLDDWVAVYAKRNPAHANLIARRGFSLVTPGNVSDGSVIMRVDSRLRTELENELKRVEGERGRMLLERLP